MEGVLHLEGNVLQIKGATRVVSTTASQAVIECAEKCIVISGSGIEVKKLNLEECEVCLQGEFLLIKFGAAQGKKQPLLKRIFK
ncbi:MAG: hypothetical protein J6A28_03060 [Clostridia bacterium]|nr:hypothetical protein [Clostridia bacterium]